MKIYIRALMYGDIILEEVDASPVQGFEDCAIVHLERRWVVYDIPTGLLSLWSNQKRMSGETCGKETPDGRGQKNKTISEED